MNDTFYIQFIIILQRNYFDQQLGHITTSEEETGNGFNVLIDFLVNYVAIVGQRMLTVTVADMS